MPDALYRSFPSADLTAELCSTMVSRALRSRNPRLLRDWLAYERNCAADRDLRDCCEIALRLEIAETSSLRDRNTLATMHAELSACFDEASTDQPAAVESIGAVTPLIDGLLLAIGAFDPQLRDHSLNVAQMAARLALAAKLPKDRVKHIVQAASVHELGRLRIDRTVLDSTEMYDATARRRIREQLADVRVLDEDPATRELGITVYGLYLADPVTATDDVRLLRVADAFQSLCEMRPRRPAFSPHEALDRLWARRGVRFDSRYLELLGQVLGYQQRQARSA